MVRVEIGGRNVLAHSSVMLIKCTVTGPKVQENSGTSAMVWEDRIRLRNVRDEIRERTNGETLDSSIKFFIYPWAIRAAANVSRNNYRWLHGPVVGSVGQERDAFGKPYRHCS